MANNYLQFSFEVVVGNDGCGTWINNLLLGDEKTGDMILSDEFLSIFEDFEEFEEMGFEWGLKDGLLGIWSGESGNIVHVANFLHALVQRDDCAVKQAGFSYAEWCSKMRPGEFGGGAVYVSKVTGPEYLSVYRWLYAAMGDDYDA